MLGIGSGAVYSALALGLVLTYRGSGLINFAHGATAMYLAYAYVELRSEGDLVFPWLGVKSRFDLGGEMEFWPAMIVTILLSAFIGLLMHTLIFRPLRNAPPLAKTVASVGVLVALQGFVVIKFGTSSKTIPGALPEEPVTFWGITIGQDRLWLAALVVLTSLALAALFRFTNFGLATRAAAENEKGAALLGYSPQRLAAINWVLATIVAGIAGVLVGPITTLDPTTYTLLVIPALSAALVARFTSFTTACAVGLALGMCQSEILNLQSTYSWWPETGTRDALPFAVIVIALVLLGKRLPTRDTIREGRLPAAIKTERLALVSTVSVAAGVVLLFTLDIGYRGPFIASINAAVIALSIVVLTGFVGQISLAQMAYAGAAGFTLAKLATDADIPFPIAPILSAGVAAVLGLLVGLPSLRVRGINLAIVSLGLSVAVVEVWFKNPGWTGGFDGSSVPEPSIFGVDLGTGNDRSLGIVSLVALTLVALSVSALRRSATGRQMLAVRANERAAAAAGINPATTKLVAFAISGFIAGIGGCLLGYQQTELSFTTFGVLISVTFLALAYLGGIASVSGAMVAGMLASGGIAFHFAQEQFEWGKYQQVFSGVGVILTAIIYKEGIAALGPAVNRRVARTYSIVHSGGPGALGAEIAGYGSAHVGRARSSLRDRGLLPAPMPSSSGTASAATWGRRARATIVGQLQALLIFGAAVGVSLVFIASDPPVIVGIGVVALGLAMIGVIAFFVYNTIYLQGTTGQTVGKRRAGLCLVSAVDHRPIGIGRVTARQVLHIVDSILYIGYLMPLWDSKRQTFADKIMNTVVVDVSPRGTRPDLPPQSRTEGNTVANLSKKELAGGRTAGDH